MKKGNYVSEWFGQRIYPDVRVEAKAISRANAGVCPFLSSIRRAKTNCIKNENSFGVCTINSANKDWLVCPYRVIDTEIVRSGCETVFAIERCSAPIPVSILQDTRGVAALNECLNKDGHAFIFFQDKLGGEISINGTPSSPEISFDVTVVEVAKGATGGIRVLRYGFIEIQTMDFHGSYKAAVTNLRDAHRLHGKKFPRELAQNQGWASENVEGPNIANVFKRTFYQTLLKFELSKEGAAAGTVLALPESVWESWQPFLGRPTIQAVIGSTFRIAGTDNETYHGTNAWIFVFRLDEKADQPISPVNITTRIRVSATDLVQHAFISVPKNMLHVASSEDELLRRIRDRIRKACRFSVE